MTIVTDYKFFSDKNWKYSPEEIAAVCEGLVKTYHTADDCGTFDGHAGFVREYFMSMPPVFDEYGGI